LQKESDYKRVENGRQQYGEGGGRNTHSGKQITDGLKICRKTEALMQYTIKEQTRIDEPNRGGGAMTTRQTKKTNKRKTTIGHTEKKDALCKKEK